MNVVILGPQGSGKGTQAAALAERTSLVHIASGDVLRAARGSGTELGNEVKRYYDAGELVPDHITVALLIDHIRNVPKDADVFLDGFPRTVVQAEALDSALRSIGEQVDAVIELEADLDVVKRRLAGRLVCPVCGTVYNTETRPPRVAGRCDLDGGELYRRADDNPEAISKRLAIWARENDQLVQFYEKKGVLTRVDANRPAAEVTDEIAAVLRGRSGAVAGG